MSVLSARLGECHTAEDLERLPEAAGRYELIKGELVEMPPPPGGPHGNASSRLDILAGGYVLENGLGETFTAETGFLISRDPDTVLAPDWAFIAEHRLPETIPNGYQIVPDIVLETRSPSSRLREVREKIRLWLAAGVRIVWDLDLDSRTVTVHRAGAEPRTLGVGDVLSGEEVLPGFSVPMRRLFRGA